MATMIAIPDLSGLLAWLKSNWPTISAILLAVISAAWPAQSDLAKTILTVISSLLGAGAVSHLVARAAVRSEAKRLGLIASSK